MTVLEMIQAMARMGIGLDDPTQDDRAVYLSYLNLAHLELYRKTAYCNPLIKPTEVIKKTLEQTGVIDLDDIPFMVKQVFDLTNKRLLVQTSYADLESKEPAMDNVTDAPYYWYQEADTICVYPKKKDIDIRIRYLEQPKPLTEETPEGDIPYPLAYHPVLIDGGCYYLFQGETGFKDQSRLGLVVGRWEKNRQELVSFLTNLSGSKGHSTYSQV